MTVVQEIYLLNFGDISKWLEKHTRKKYKKQATTPRNHHAGLYLLFKVVLLKFKKMKTQTHYRIDTRRPKIIRQMFDSIASTYDLLNHLLSFGLDIRWRKKAVAFLKDIRSGAILDICAGSGDITLTILKQQSPAIIAADFSFNMLKVFQHKLAVNRKKDSIAFACCDALSLPFKNGTFDGTIVAFGIRNFEDRSLGFHEMYRILKPDGISIILELTTPASPKVRFFYRVYSRLFLPFIGKIISRHVCAYNYLPKSVTNFPDNLEIMEMMSEAGFVDIRIIPLSRGIATIFVGRKLES